MVVIFQPAEEGGAGGKEMCDDGMMERFGIEEVYGMHNWPGRPVGSFAIREGAFFAATDQFEITVTGRGGHAAKPQETVDPRSRRRIWSRCCRPSPAATPTRWIRSSSPSPRSKAARTAFNVIPQEVRLKGTVRTMSAEMRALRNRLTAIAEQVCAAMGGAAEVTYHRGYPCMVNHPEQTAFAAEVARAVSGDCDEAPLVMGGEDFAFMLEERPGAYILVGNGEGAMVHHPEYNFNDEAIPAGCSWLAEVVERRLPAAG